MVKLRTHFFVTLIFSVVITVCLYYLINAWNVKLRPPKPRHNAVTRYFEHYVNVPQDDGITWPNYPMVGDRQFFIYSVIAFKSKRDSARWNHVIINGWENPTYVNDTYTCCFFYDDNETVTESPSIGKNNFTIRNDVLEARQVICDHPEGPIPKSFSLAVSTDKCNDDNHHRNTIIYPKDRPDDQFAICGKIVYGFKEPAKLIEWIEYQLYFRVDKILLYPYQDLNLAALNVLRFYALNNDVVEVIPMPFVAEQDKYVRYFRYPKGTTLVYQDEQVIMFDSQARLHNFRYMAVYDTDEFPALNADIADNLPDMMRYLSRRYTLAGSFAMKTHFHSLSVPPTSPGEALMIARYGTRSLSIMDRVKFIHDNDRIKPGTVWIHHGQPIDGYRTYILQDWELVIKHFRRCYTQKEHESVADPDPCFNTTVRDDYTKHVADAIAPSVRRVAEILEQRAEKRRRSKGRLPPGMVAPKGPVEIVA